MSWSEFAIKFVVCSLAKRVFAGFSPALAERFFAGFSPVATNDFFNARRNASPFSVPWCCSAMALAVYATASSPARSASNATSAGGTGRRSGLQSDIASRLTPIFAAVA